jgi:hypothetical protein
VDERISRMPLPRITITIPADTVRRIDRLAKMRGGRSRSETITDLCEEALEHAELAAAATSDPVVMGAFAKAMSEPGVLRSVLGALRSDLSDEQLALFTSRVEGLTASSSGKKRKR